MGCGSLAYIQGIKVMPKALTIFYAIILAVAIFIPITEIIIKIIQNILSKCIKPKLIPKMDFSSGVPKDETTMIVIPSILKNRKRCKKNLEKARSILLSK